MSGILCHVFVSRNYICECDQIQIRRQHDQWLSTRNCAKYFARSLAQYYRVEIQARDSGWGGGGVGW